MMAFLAIYIVGVGYTGFLLYRNTMPTSWRDWHVWLAACAFCLLWPALGVGALIVKVGSTFFRALR